MPVTFLTKEHRRRYGRYHGDPGPEQLARYFHLDDADRSLILRLRRTYNQLGFALQLCTVRFLGTFLDDPTAVPTVAARQVAAQLGINDPSILERYAKEQTQWKHARQIRAQYGYRDFGDRNEGFRLVRWLYTRCWMSEERPSVLFDMATARLIERKVLLPGATTLERVVARVRDRSARRLWKYLAALPSKEQLGCLEALLEVPDGERTSDFDRLRRGPIRISGPALASALQRLKTIRELNTDFDVFGVPPNVVTSLARQASKAMAQTIRRMGSARRRATLVAFASQAKIMASDDALDVFDSFMTDVAAKAKTAGEKKRLASLEALDIAAMRLVEACGAFLDDTVEDAEVRQVAFARVSRKQLREAIGAITEVTRPKGDRYRKERADQYRRFRPFLSAFLETFDFEGTSAGEAVLRAVEFLRSIEGQRKPDMNRAPRAVIPRAWRPWVITKSGGVERRAYTVCVLEQLQDRLRARDVFIRPSERWSDPRLKLLRGPQWQALKAKVCRSLGRHESAEHELNRLTKQLDECYRRTVAALPINPDVTVERHNGHDRLAVSRLDKLDEREGLIELRDAVDTLLPRVDLPEALLEIEALTGFASAFTHISERHAAVNDFPTSLCAVLMAEACNTGLEPIVRSDVPALRRSRLSWVGQSFIRSETIARGNAKLVNYQATLPLARKWGEGDVASADGLRFRIPVRTAHAGPNPKYFGFGRGVTYLNFTSDQGTGFHGIVVPGTLRDSLFILDGLLEHETELNPKELMTDTAGASDIVFALFWLLGFQFSPRLADIGGARFWRIDPKADYGPLNDLSRHRLHPERIVPHWDDMLRVAGSLKTSTVSASELMRSLLRTKRPSSLARALRELGRIPKTIHHLNYISDPLYRRRTLTQLNHHENRHRLSRKVGSIPTKVRKLS